MQYAPFCAILLQIHNTVCLRRPWKRDARARKEIAAATLVKLKAAWKRFFIQIPPDLERDFALHCAKKKNWRFSILPIFNIITQLGCFFIYLYVYPLTFPELPRLNPVFFTAFSAAYVAVNILFLVLFNRLRRKGHGLPALRRPD
ncbi:MAG: hypothetical protein GXY32_09725 [Ruminococcaceae bacterium]|nr:hypothetical protein [Oscillospiraceae bacterium]